MIAATPDELTALRATLASREAFTRYGIDKPLFLSTLSFKVGKAATAMMCCSCAPPTPFPNRFVTFLVEVNWARGRLMREYTVLLDPPVYTPGETASSSAPVAAPTTTTTAPRRAAPTADTPAPAAAASSAGSSIRRPAPRTSAPSGASTVQVGRGDTLTKIARGLSSDGSPANVDQTMMALYRANPDAFGGNINVLRQGAGAARSRR